MEPCSDAPALIAQSDGLLLDFDGPVCDFYAGANPAQIAQEIRDRHGLAIETDDPLDLIIHAVNEGCDVDAINASIASAELTAVRDAIETSGARRLIENFDGLIAVVSNNDTEAIEAWLSAVDLRSPVASIVGRDPRRMKPDPWAIFEAVKLTKLTIEKCVFVGDSLSDAEAAERAGAPFVAFANKPGKAKAFLDRGCDGIVENMNLLDVDF